jgi:excisionase family DNA binding protein
MPQMLRVPEVAEQLSLSAKTVYRLIERGKLGHHKIGHAVRVSAKQLAEFIEESERAPAIAAPTHRARRRKLKFI